MSRFAQQGRRATGIRAFGCRFGRTGAAAGALALALPLMLSLAPQALAQTSGIYINNDVLNSLGPGPSAAPLAPAAPAVNPALPVQPLAPQPQTGSTLNFQTYGSGNYVVTRPGTLLFPPLEAPTSTLAPGFTDNNAARSEAMTNAFAEGPEPTSQLLIPLDGSPAADSSVVVFMDNLPPADPAAAGAEAPVLTLRRPALAAPAPAPRKPEVSAEMLAETGATSIDDATATLAPEFQTPEPETAPAAPEKAEVAAATPEASSPATMTAPAAEATAAAAQPAPPQTMAAGAPAAVSAEAKAEATPVSSAESAAPAAPAESAVPVSLLPQTAETAAADSPLPSAEVPAPITQTAVLPPAGDAPAAPAAAPGQGPGGAAVADMSFVFDPDSAELSAMVQNELRSLADSMRARDDGRIQVLGFASAEGGSDDLARRLALSRALKVRTFLIDAGVPSARIQVRSLGAQSDGGPANRVDIRPIDS